MVGVLHYLKRRHLISQHLRRNGLISLIKTVFQLLINQYFFVYQEYFVFFKTMETKTCDPKIKNFKLKIVTSEKQLTELSKSCDISYLFDVDTNIQEKFKNRTLFCIFVNKELAHRSWVMTNGINPLPSVDLRNDIYICPCATNPKYQGLGLYPYTLCKIFEHAKRIGKMPKIGASAKNIASFKGIINAGFRVYAKGTHMKIFTYERRKEKVIVPLTNMKKR